MHPENDLAPLQRLDDLIAREQSALLAGDLASVQALEEQKIEAAEAIAGLPKGDPEVAKALKALKTRAERNAALISASARGLRSVIERLEESRRVSTHLETYTPAGQRQSYATGGASVERRA